MSRRRWWTGALFALGLVLAAGAVWHLLVLGPTGDPLHGLAELSLVGGSTAAAFYGWYWHTTRSLPAGRYPRIFAWVVAGTLLFLGTGTVVLYVGSEQVAALELAESGQLAGSVGAVVGLLIGTVEAERILTAEAAARATTRAEALQAETERLDRLTGLMRHYVLNGVNVISGHADLLAADATPAEVERLERIQDRAATIATLVEHVRVLSRAERGEFTPTETDLDTVVEQAVERTSLPDGLTVTRTGCAGTVRAPPSLARALRLLFDALSAATDDGGSITVTCSRTAPTTTVAVTATSAELPPAVAATPFEPLGPDIGLELYLAHGLVSPYADLALARNEDGTVRFELTFDD